MAVCSTPTNNAIGFFKLNPGSLTQNLTDYEKALVNAILALSAKTKGYFELTVCSTPTNHAIVALLS